MNESISENLITYSAFIFIILIFAFLVFFIASRQRQNKLYQDKINQQRDFESRLLRSQLEIQEETSEHISREIHDDVGQILSVAHIYLQSIEQSERVIKTGELISKAIGSLRNISHSLNASQLLHTGIVNALETELNQIEESGKMKTFFQNNIESFVIKPDKELILFRTCQEALNNAIKHSGADQLNIIMNEDPMQYTISISDDGKGFNLEAEKNNIAKNGLRNMQKRLELIGAEIRINTNPNKGTQIKFILLKDHE